MKLHHLTFLTPILALFAVQPAVESESAPVAFNAKTAAQRIDRLLAADLARAKLTPNPRADDATFVRRAYLGIVGRIPTGGETLRFLNSQGNDKRFKLVDQLLASPGYASHMFNFWADLLRVKTRLTNQTSGAPFMHYIKDSIASNKPYDAFVRDMIAASGAAHAPGNGATGLLMRDRGMPLDSMANTVRVFLGTRLECAQCHNHPFDSWKQKDFYQMAAFTGGLSYRGNQRDLPPAVRKVAAEVRTSKDRPTRQALNRMMRQMNNGITGSGTGKIRLPKDYQYDDAKPREVVEAHAIFGKSPKIDYPAPRRDQRDQRRRGRNRRQPAKPNRRRGNPLQVPQLGTRAAYAGWLTSKDNPRFTKVIANRMWRATMGRGLIEPVDNITDTTRASNESLMRYLEKLMVTVKFDLRKFQRVLFYTAAYQREATKTDVPADQKYYFQGPVLRRMTAEQAWDSMLTFVVPDIDGRLEKPGAGAKAVYDAYEKFASVSEQELRAQIQQQRLRYADPKKYREQQRQRQARTRQKAQQERRQKQQEQQRQRAELRKKSQPIYRALIKARRAEDEAKIASLKDELRALGIDPDAPANRNQRGRNMAGKRPARRAPNRGRGGGRGNRMARASDLPQPAPDGHFLRNFGQSDRDQIQASHTEANVPQVLTLLNGFVETRVLANDTAELMRSIRAVSSNKEKVRRAYLGILNREPRGRESAIWELDMDRGGDAVVRDLVWTLANTHEFRFIQ